MAGGGRIRPRLFFAMGDVLSTHLDDARRQHITGESRSAQRAPGAQLGAPGLRHHPGPLFALWLGSRESQAPGKAGVAGDQVHRPSLFPPRLGAPSQPLLSSPFPLPRALKPPPHSTGTSLEPVPSDPQHTTPMELWEGSQSLSDPPSSPDLGYPHPEALQARRSASMY